MPAEPHPTPRVSRDAGDAVELAELLCFLADWLDSADSDILDASLQRFAHAAYGRTDLQADLARLAFLLGADGSRLFGDTV